MKRFSSFIAASVILVGCASGPVAPETVQSRILDEGGSGPYKALMYEAPNFDAHTVFAPQDLSAFNKRNPLPVLVWGNGGCINSPWEHCKFLNEIASHGFLVIASGYIPMDDTPYRGPSSTSVQQLEAVDWAVLQNENKNSPFYGRIDTDAIAAAGMSCGGLQTLDNSADPRFKTLMIMNSGLFVNSDTAMPGMPMPEKEKLQNIKVPVLYVLGGETDIAYVNGMDDFARLTEVPAFVGNYPVGHGGTYRETYGGEFRFPALAWLQWQLQGNKEAAKMFQGEECGLSQREGWTVDKNSLID